MTALQIQIKTLQSENMNFNNKNVQSQVEQLKIESEKSEEAILEAEWTKKAGYVMNIIINNDANK